MAHVNIEIKARSSDQNKVRGILKSRGAEFKCVDHQVDTYFKVNRGRLKLRDGDIESNLIYYEREDKVGPKQSDIIFFRAEPESSLKEVLTRALGVLVVVDKRREIYFIDNVKFHVDTVEGLGTFIEIEAIDYDGDLGRDKLLEQCEFFLDLLDVSRDDLVSVSYSDLMLRK